MGLLLCRLITVRFKHKNSLAKADDADDVAKQLQRLIHSEDVAALEQYCNARTAEGCPLPLQYMLKTAVGGKSTAMLQFVFAQGAKVDQGLEAFVADVDGRSLEFYHTLADQGWPQGYRPLRDNLHHGSEVVALLLDRGHIVDVPCLKVAVDLGDVQLLALLMSSIDTRCKVPTRSDYLQALDDPAYWSKPAMFSEPASLKRIVDGAGLLQTAAEHKHVEIVRYLLEVGADLSLVPVEEQSPNGINGCALHKAVSMSVEGKPPNLDIVQALLEAGADPLLKDSLGRTAIEINDVWGGGLKDQIRQLLMAKVSPA